MGKVLNFVKRAPAYTAVGLLFDKMYDGYRALVDNGITETAGEALGRSETLGNVVNDVHGYTGTTLSRLYDIPVLGNVAEAVRDAVPSDTGEFVGTALLLAGGCILLRHASKFAHEPIRYMEYTGGRLREIGARIKSTFTTEHGAGTRPMEALKGLTSCVWDKVKYSPFYLLAMPAAALGSDRIDPIVEPSGEVLTDLSGDLYRFFLDGNQPTWLESAVENGTEFLVKFGLPAYIVSKAGNSLIKKYDRGIERSIEFVKSFFRSRRNDTVIDPTN
jgi:hypothetical protein